MPLVSWPVATELRRAELAGSLVAFPPESASALWMVSGVFEKSDDGTICGSAEGIDIPRVFDDPSETTGFRNLRFLRVTLPDPASFTRYCLCGSASTTCPTLSHL